MGTIVVREIRSDKPYNSVFILPAAEYTLFEFQNWMLGVYSDGGDMPYTERDEILAYYPNLTQDQVWSMYDTDHIKWADPDGLDVWRYNDAETQQG